MKMVIVIRENVFMGMRDVKRLGDHPLYFDGENLVPFTIDETEPDDSEIPILAINGKRLVRLGVFMSVLEGLDGVYAIMVVTRAGFFGFVCSGFQVREWKKGDVAIQLKDAELLESECLKSMVLSCGNRSVRVHGVKGNVAEVGYIFPLAVGKKSGAKSFEVPLHTLRCSSQYGVKEIRTGD